MTLLAEPSTNVACWACGHENPASAQFCAACGKLQPAAPADYFQFFGLPRRLQLDLSALEKQFYRLSRKFHPDLYAHASAQEQQRSLEKSSLLNDAWRTLRDPLSRTEYLLELQGIRWEEQSRDATDAATAGGTAKKQIVPPDLLEEVFELNMQLEEMRAARVHGQGDPALEADLQAARQNFEGQLDAAMQRLQSLWVEWDQAADARDETAQLAAQQKIVDLLNRRGYIRNLVRDVQAALGS
jgi:molecular chaperone HscB